MLLNGIISIDSIWLETSGYIIIQWQKLEKTDYNTIQKIGKNQKSD